MRWSIISLIWLRELRDQLRDHRTLFTIVALPLLLYPLMSFAVVRFALDLFQQKSIVGIVQGKHSSNNFPLPSSAKRIGPQVLAASCLTATPGSPGLTDRTVGAVALATFARMSLDYPLLLENGKVPRHLLQGTDNDLSIFPGEIELDFQFLSRKAAENALSRREIDMVLLALPNFLERITKGKQPTLKIWGRQNDDRSKRAAEQLRVLLNRWKTQLKEVRLLRKSLPTDFDEPFAVFDPHQPENAEMLAAASLLDVLVRTLPFMLVMWSLIGALHPAIDLCAGEKERGTMETLLISPAARSEIVFGKFLTIWVFSAGTAVLHLVSMFLSTWQLREHLPQATLTLPALGWCVALILPLAALFSSVSLAVGAYARSSKEGQSYLMPLFWVTMLLMLLTFSPDVELNPFYSMVPVTGVVLLMQRLMLAPNLSSVPWSYFLPVFGTILLWSWLALRWAKWQFQREEVLFRSAEKWDLRIWLGYTFSRKEMLPGILQTALCFGVLFLLRSVSTDLGREMPLTNRNMVILLAFVAAPPVFMGLLLTTHPLRTLRLAAPRPGYLLAALLLLPLAEMAHLLFIQFDVLQGLFRERRLFVQSSYEHFGGESLIQFLLHYVVVMGFLQAACKELAFRGFILSGLMRRFSLWPAILLSSLLFAVWHMNVFALLPFFLLGVVNGILAARSGSLLPGIMLHMGCNLLLLHGPLASFYEQRGASPSAWALAGLILLAVLCTAGVAWLLYRLDNVEKDEAPPLAG